MANTLPGMPLLLCFPELDPKAAGTPPKEAVFFDPGARPQPSPRAWKPDNLPLGAETVQAFLRESERFAQEHGKAGRDLTAQAMNKDDFYAQTSLAIRARLTEVVDPQKSAKNQAVQAQQVLLLAWQLEQQVLEIQAIQQAVRKGWDDLARILGRDEADDSLSLAGEHSFFEDDPQDMPWRMILEAILFFAPPAVVLVTGDREVLAALDEWQDDTALTVPAATSLAINPLIASGAGRLIHGPGWRLAGRTRCPVDKPWLELPRSVLLFALNEHILSLKVP